MPTWMIHPKHGRTPAIGAEIDWNIKNGWVIDPDYAKPVVKSTPVEPQMAPEQVQEQTSEQKRKPGRPKKFEGSY